jgi:hypoxanthine phosphoribosyltransferase
VEQPREVLTWSDFDTSVWQLAERIAADGVADTVLTLASGRGVSDS